LTGSFVELRDGRRLAYCEHGDRAGHPTLFCHGFPGSGAQAALAAPAASEAGVRLIAPDRPGSGASDRRPQRRLLEWPADVAQLADRLGLARFAIVGVSGGGPYALACAHAMPERIDAVAVVSGIAPLDDEALLERMRWSDRLVLRTARRTPRLVRGLLQPAIVLRAFPDAAFRLLAVQLGAPDREVLRRDAVRRLLARALAESLRQGVGGTVDDLLVLARPWGFRLQDVAPCVHLWHGGRDRVVPAQHCDYLRERLPRSRYLHCPQDGHFSLVIDRVGEVFAALAAARDASAPPGDPGQGGERSGAAGR
jgi:pimeloyl-ACP methyl ester carboxylesterase